MKIKHPKLRSMSVQSSKGLFKLDADGMAEVSPELGEHLLACGYVDMDAEAEVEAKPAKVAEPEAPVAPPEAPVTDDAVPVKEDEPKTKHKKSSK